MEKVSKQFILGREEKISSREKIENIDRLRRRNVVYGFDEFKLCV